MKVACYLSMLSQELQEKMQSNPIYRPWIDAGLTLAQISSDLGIMQMIYEQLSPRERRVMLSIVIRMGCECFDCSKLQGVMAAFMSGAEVKVGLFQLVNKGLLFTLRKSWGELVYVMADDSLSMWQRILWEDGQLIVSIRSDTSISEHTDEQAENMGSMLSEAIFKTMVYMTESEVKLLKNGVLHKRQLLKWIQLLSIQNDWLAGARISYPHADRYPAAVAIVMDLMIRLGILKLGKTDFRLNNEAATMWLQMDVAAQQFYLYELWKQVVFPAKCWLQHAVLLVERQPLACWFDCKGILAWLQNNEIINEGTITEHIVRIKQLEECWLLPLLAFGWLEKADCNNGMKTVRVYRWRHHPLLVNEAKPEGRASGLYVQPDFEVLVPPDISYAIRWELTAMADHLRTDTMTIFRISAKSITRGLESGRSLRHMLEFLERHAMHGIPDNVEQTVEQWAMSFDRIQSERAWKPGSDYSLGRQVPLILVTSNTVKPDKLKVQLDTAKGFIDTRISARQYELDQSMPDVQHVWQGSRSIPAAWTQAYRSYHSSTRRQLIETAIKWETAIRIRIAGIEHTLIPRSIEDENGEWTVIGFGEFLGTELRLSPEQWQEMKIVIPRIDEKY